MRRLVVVTYLAAAATAALATAAVGTAATVTTDGNSDGAFNNDTDAMRKSHLPYYFQRGRFKPKELHVKNMNQTSGARRWRLAVLVPFRDRFQELMEFLPHMHQFLARQGIHFHIFIISQNDGYRFNRGSLINVGFLYTRKNYDYMALHDVDLLPLNNNLKYDYPRFGPVHISTPEKHPNYRYPNYLGGILLIKRKHFELVHGMSNYFWGWGREDEEFHKRLKMAGLSVTKPANITTGKNDTFKHLHDAVRRPRDKRRCGRRRRARPVRPQRVRYRLRAARALSVESGAATVLDVLLLCNRSATPWCTCRRRARY